jgi:hypothetical protein
MVVINQNQFFLTFQISTAVRHFVTLHVINYYVLFWNVLLHMSVFGGGSGTSIDCDEFQQRPQVPNPGLP